MSRETVNEAAHSSVKTGAALRRALMKRGHYKYAANLQENTHTKV